MSDTFNSIATEINNIPNQIKTKTTEISTSMKNATKNIGEFIYLIIYLICLGYIVSIIIGGSPKDSSISNDPNFISESTEKSKTFLGSLSVHKTSIFKLILLFIFVTISCNTLVNDPNKIVSQYPSIFTSLLILVALYVFYYTFNYDTNFIDVRYDIINTSIILICFLFFAFFFYYYNPQGEFMEYFANPIYFVFICFGIFLLLYLLLFIFSTKKSKEFFSFYLPSVIPSSDPEFKEINDNKSKLFSFMKYFMSVSGIIILLSVLISIFGTKIAPSFSTSDTTSLFINIVFIIVVAAVIFKLITYTNLYQNNLVIQLIINVIFYIPCILIAFIDNFVKLTGISSTKKNENIRINSKGESINIKTGKVLSDVELKETENGFNPTTTDYILLIVAVLLNVIYFTSPYIASRFSTQGGKLLVNNPIYTNKENYLGDYISLNGSDDFNFHYAISFWVYIDSTSPSMSNAYTKYTSLLNYGNKPNVMYRGLDNTLMVVMQNHTSNNKYKPIGDLDEFGNRIIYIKKDVLLQKWNNIIINYNGGTLDIFYNGELVKSAQEVVPYTQYDNLTVGSENGIRGGICNVNYFNKNLNIQQINVLYNFVKDKTPPVYKNSEETIVNIAKDVPNNMNSTSATNYYNTLVDKF
jgi:hypothetical protein